MDAVTYQHLRLKYPHLALPKWQSLRPTDKHKAKAKTPEELITSRARVLMVRDPGITDRGQKVYAFRPL